MNSIELTTLDLAKFFYNEDIGLKNRKAIIFYLWKKKYKYLEYHMYDNFKMFSNEIDNLLMDLAFENVILEEIDEIRTIQNGLESDYIGYGFYKLNKSMTEDFLKQCKLRIMYTSNRDYIYMKMRTLVKACGYKVRTKKMIEELSDKMLKLELYMSDGHRELTETPSPESRRIRDVKMDENIRIYSH